MSAITDQDDGFPARIVPLEWKLWFVSGLTLAMYVVVAVLHWVGQLHQIPTGLSTLAHIGVVVPFIAGIAVWLDGRRKARAGADGVKAAVARAYVDGVRERHRRYVRR